ncbi:hypothetical protein KKC22_11340, partial [Myxococcota bacterium]|nr:hypothetical protein [Myxococcota bacterium]
MGHRIWFFWVFLAVGCGGKGSGDGSEAPRPVPRDAAVAVEDAPSQPEVARDATPVPAKVLQDPVYLCGQGTCEWIERRDAEKKNLSLIDLRDDFVPMIFSERSEGKEDFSKNNYREIYLKLAQDKTDEDGNALKKDEHNYLELFGIPPTLTVLGERFRRSRNEACSQALDYGKFRNLKGFIQWNPGNVAKYKKRYDNARSSFEGWARKHKIQNPDAWLADPANAKKNDVVRNYVKARNLYDGLVELKKRMECEEIVAPGELKEGIFDEAMHRAIRRFERKHRIFGWGYVNEKMLPFLHATLLENDYQSLVRMVTERVAMSLAIFEDGSVRHEGKPNPARPVNLIGDMTKLTLDAMGLETPEKAAAFFERHTPADFAKMVVAVALPPLPEYYSSHMDIEVKINIGDVWYDFPYNPDGTMKEQPRGQLPYNNVYVKHRGELISLTRMGTTTGGWQYEYTEKQVFMKYKGSDLGPREWKYVVGAPVWFPPATTPPRELVEHVQEKGSWIPKVKFKQLGPSYASAYGLAMAIHSITRHRPGGEVEDWDAGIRSHGSVNYMSILYGTSHGCHRLHNHLAVRLFSNLLKRRTYVRKGQLMTEWRHIFGYGGKTHVINLETKGYYFELTPPIPIVVTRAGVLGNVKTPIQDVIRVPGKAYPEDLELGLELTEDGSLQPVAPPPAEDGESPSEDGTPLPGEGDRPPVNLPPPPAMVAPGPAMAAPGPAMV